MKPERAVLDPNAEFMVDQAEMPKPQPGPQEKALRAKFVNQLFFGGARGGGKSFTLLLDFAQDVPTYGKNWRGIIFRRTYPELDEILAESRRIFYQAFPGAEYKVGQRKWFFPNGAELSLRHLENEAAADSYQGHQYTWVVALRLFWRRATASAGSDSMKYNSGITLQRITSSRRACAQALRTFLLNAFAPRATLAA